MFSIGKEGDMHREKPKSIGCS